MKIKDNKSVIFRFLLHFITFLSLHVISLFVVVVLLDPDSLVMVILFFSEAIYPHD